MDTLEQRSLEDRAKAPDFDVDSDGNLLMSGKVVCTEPVRNVSIYGAECMLKLHPDYKKVP